MNKFRKNAADFLTSIVFFIFVVTGIIFIIPFATLFFVISWISPDQGLSSKEFNERMNMITEKLDTVLSKD